jgi:hypothetical protein
VVASRREGLVPEVIKAEDARHRRGLDGVVAAIRHTSSVRDGERTVGPSCADRGWGEVPRTGTQPQDRQSAASALSADDRYLLLPDRPVPHGIAASASPCSMSGWQTRRHRAAGPVASLPRSPVPRFHTALRGIGRSELLRLSRLPPQSAGGRPSCWSRSTGEREVTAN